MDSLEFLNKYCSSITKPRQRVLIEHSNLVLKKSLEVAKKHPELKVDLVILKNSAILHDIGVCKLTKDTPYIQHGIIGKKVLLNSGFKNIANVCERHIGSGLTSEEASILGLPKENMLPETIEEKIVCYADKFFSKTKNGEHSIKEIRDEFSNYGIDSLNRFEELRKLLS